MDRKRLGELRYWSTQRCFDVCHCYRECDERIEELLNGVDSLLSEVERLMKILADDSGVMKSRDPNHTWEFKLCPECTKRLKYVTAVGGETLGEE